jgi:putative MFS transporter
MFILGGVPGLVVALLLTRLPESPRWLIGQGRFADADAVIRDMEAQSGIESRLPEPRIPNPESRIANPESRLTELLSSAYRRRTLTVWVLWACAYFITNGLNNWMPTLYSTVYHLSLTQALRAGTLTNVAQVAILLGCAFAIDRIGRRRWTIAGFTAGAALLVTLGTFAAHSVTAVIVLVTVSYGIVGSVNAVLYLYTPEIYPTRMRAIGTGAATCWLRLASAVGPVLVGYLVSARGTAAVFLMFAAAGVGGAVVAMAMLETRNRSLEELSP